MKQLESTAFVGSGESELEQSVPTRFEQQVERYASRLAVQAEAVSFTYAELNRSANRLARAIIARCGTAHEPVVLLIQNRALLVVAILAVLKAGKFYVVLDASDPPARVGALLADSDARLLLYSPETASSVAQLSVAAERTLDLTDVDASLSADNLGLRIDSDAYLNLLYTSGSSGQPKGVLQTHRNVLHTTRSAANRLRMSVDDRFALLSPPVTGVWSALAFSSLLTGGSVFPVDVRSVGLAGVAALLADERITIYYSLPSVLRNMLRLLPAETRFPDLRCVKVGAEPLLRSDLELLRPHVQSDCEVQITYGTTETYVATSNKVRIGEYDGPDVVPVGFPDEDKELLIVDEHGQRVPRGEVGELFVKSRYLSPGYWRQPELTDSTFTRASDGERIYRLGDLGRWLPDGQLEHLGRKDLQVKLRGHLVALSEVETALRRLDLVQDAVVVGRDTGRESKQLVAYVVVSDGSGTNTSVLRAGLATSLPEHMIPSVFVVVDRLPLLPNGKLDVRALPDPSSDRPALSNAYVAPRTPLETRLTEIWSAVLGVDRIGVHDAFGELGGDSVQAAQVLARASDACQVDLPLSILFEAGTVAELADRISKRLTATLESADLARLLDELESLSEAETQDRLTRDGA